MLLHPASARIAGHNSHHFPSTATAVPLVRLQLLAALIAKHKFPSALPKITPAYAESFREWKRKGHPATGRPLLSRENSSNGGLCRQNFLAKSYEPGTGVSRNFL